MQLLLKLFLIGIFSCALISCEQKKSDNITIGIIEPLEHTAMTEIVSGFTQTLKKIYPQTIIIKVANAQNDANLQRAIIQKMHDNQYDIVIPIGVGATQMSLSMIHNLPIVGLASNIEETDRKKMLNCNVAIVHDEISANESLAFIHAIYPKLKQLALIHSTADKVIPEAKETIKAAKKYGITVKAIMVSSLPELTSNGQSISPDTQGLFILKDSMIVSGISTLAKIAKEHHIPLITSDEGSVVNGAALSLGVKEREIGKQGALLVADILNGKKPCDLPIVQMKNLTVFINSHAAFEENMDISSVKKIAEKFNYKIETVKS